MYEKTKLSLFLSCALILTGCSGYYMSHPATAPASAAASQQTQSQNIQNIPPVTNDFVENSRVAADYKEYGERTPRDQLVVDGGAGSNLSASIPPVGGIEEEVVDYEESVSISETEEANGGNGQDNGSAEDPVEDWLAEEGKTLKTLLTEWSDRAGWRLVWNTNRNYT